MHDFSVSSLRFWGRFKEKLNFKEISLHLILFEQAQIDKIREHLKQMVTKEVQMHRKHDFSRM